jgi:hypothetical protein
MVESTKHAPAKTSLIPLKHHPGAVPPLSDLDIFKLG